MNQPAHQTGAAFLALLLALLTGSSWLLLSDLNAQTQARQRDARNRLALNQAKQALLFYAMNYPDLRGNPEKGPGFLPCPDRDNDGRPESNCSANAGTTIGRLPFTILGLDDPRDQSGERLWYAVSDNLRNTLPNAAVVNSATPGLLSVDGVNDLAAVVIAPGAPVGAQGGRPGNDAAEYLEGANSDGDGSFATRGPAPFNDQLAVLTRAELMAAAELRVIHQARAALARYRAAHLAYPWLAPFADPRADRRVLRGTHTGNNNESQLRDRRADFAAWGVAAGDAVINVTDGSRAVATTVSAKALGVARPAYGADNDFDRGDVYFIAPQALARALSGAAQAGSGGLVLKGAARFDKLGIVPGDVIDNAADGSRGVVQAVKKTSLRVASLTGGAANAFAYGAAFRVRTNAGVATANSAGLSLADSAADFIAMGVAAGDLVENLSDGSFGIVATVDSPTRLTAAGLRFGRNNEFNNGDSYRLPRYNGRRGARKGLLPLHEPGKSFPSGFTVDWLAAEADGAVLRSSDPALPIDVETQAALESGSAVAVPPANGRCFWINDRVAECAGTSATANYAGAAIPAANGRRYRFNLRYSGASVTRTVAGERQRGVCLGYGPACASPGMATLPNSDAGVQGRAGAGATGLTLQDPSVNFLQHGVAPGDTVFNMADDSAGMVATIDRHSLTAATLEGGAENDFDPGEAYRISKPLVSLDYLDGAATQATFSLTIPPAGAAGRARVDGIAYHFSEAAGELPPWFIKNRWHQLLYAAYSAEFAPGGDGDCEAGVDCLVLRGAHGARDDRAALTISAGMGLAGQDRSSGSLADYYEGANADPWADDVFDNGDLGPAFNDQAVFVAP